MIQIKHLDGSKVLELEIPEGASVHRELMGEHYMRMQFSLGEPVYLKLGDYVDTDFGRFELTSPYSPKYNTDTDGYDYDLQLDAYYIKWKNKKCRYNPKNAASETSFHLTASVSVHLEVIIRSINAISKKDANFLYQGKEFSFVLKGFNGDVKAAKYKQYDNTDIIAALNDLATVFESEWWVEDNIIYFGRCELGEEVSFELNKNVEYMSSDVSKAEYANRIIAFGSTRNLPRDYRKDTTSEVIINGIAQKRLMLPLSECPNGYIQDTDIKSETEAIEAVVIDEDIYPRTKCKVSKVETYTSKVIDEETGEEIEYTYYRLTDGSGFNFSSDFIIEGETLHILFQSGKMNGMDFECQYNDKEKYYEVVLNENYGRPLPDVNLHPEVNDEFVLYNWDATKIGDTGLIDAAEKELFDAMKDKLAKMKIDPNTHECKMNSVWYEREMASADGEYVHYTLGQKVSLKNPAYNKEPRHSRIIGFDINLDIPYDTPTYQVGEATVYSQGADLQAQIDSLTFNGVSYENGGTGGSSVFIITSTSTTQSTDINVHSAKRSDQRFLRKDANDTARGVITYEQQSVHQRGAQFGSMFVSGLAGVGGRIDKDGNAELESLVLRSFLEVPELRFNRIDVVSGELWNSIAFGTISSVTVDANGTGGTAWVHLEETERCGLHIGDICRGIFADFGDGKPKDENEDANGFQKTYGFSTAYFTPTSIIKNEEGEFGFMYKVQPGTNVHPCAYMKFAVYGSFTDPSRRASAYFTRSYMRYLKDVQTWRIIPDKNIASQFGNLDGLTIGGMAMKGEGTFLSNIYMTGAVIQFSPEQKEELKGQDAYSVVLSDYEAVLHVSTDGYVRDIYKIREVVASNGNVMAMKDGVAVNVCDLGYNATAAVQVYKGKDIMHHAPIVGKLAYTVAPKFYNCEGFVTNGVLIVNKVVNAEENAYVDIEVNCEGFAVFTKHFAITVIKDASSPVVVDLDNDMDTVVENPLTGAIIGSPLTTTAMMRYGTDDMEIVSMTAVSPLPNGVSVNIEGSTATIAVSKDAGNVSNVTFRVVGKTAVSETLHTREVRFVANKVKSQYQLKLVPSTTEVKVDADGTFGGASTARVKCQALVNDGQSAFTAATYADLKSYRARMFYGLNATSDAPDFANEVTEDIYANGLQVSASDSSVTFWLYYYPNGIGTASGAVMFDKETIPVLHDAADSMTQFVFKRTNADSVAAPTGGSYTSSIPAGWSDGVPSGKELLWMSKRKFTSNGLNQDEAWSTPRPMTDTADFDVCFHDAVPGDAAPAAPPRSMHPTQTGMEGNNGWYDLGKESSEWIAMATCSNGVWSDWSVVKIVGESPVVADIDNEMDGIGVGSDGILDVATTTSTNVFMYYGHRLMYIRSVSASGLPSGVTASASFPSGTDHSRCTVTFSIAKDTDFSVQNRYAIVLTVIATHNDVDYTRTLTYTLLGTTNGKDGEVYYLQPSTTAVTRDKDLVYHPASLTCARYVKKGVSDPVASPEGEIKMSTNGGDTWTRYDEITTSSLSGVNSVIYRWMLNGTEVDRETVPVIADGQSALSLQVSQTQGAVQLNNYGLAVKDSTFSVTAKAFFGTDKEYITGVSYSGNGNLAVTYSISSGIASISIKASKGTAVNGSGSNIADNVDISFTLQTARGTLTFTFTVAGTRNGGVGAILRPCGEWSADKTYYNNSQWVDAVYYNKTFWYVTPSEDGSEVSISGSDHVPGTSGWTQGSYMDFVATNLFLSKKIYTDMIALLQMKAGYEGSDGLFVPVIDIDGSGKLTITSGSGKSLQKLVAESGTLKIYNFDGKSNTTISSAGIGSSEGFSLYEDGLRLGNGGSQLEIEPNLLSYGGVQTTWEKVIEVARGIRIKVVSSLPSTTEANVLYVVI